ncbi:MAG: cell wall hydrolase [Lachnospiraceae bacterium]
MRKYLNKKELLWYINLILLILVLHDRGFGPASAYACDPDQEAYEIDDTVNPADGRLDMDSGTAAEGDMDQDDNMITDNDLDTDNKMSMDNDLNSETDTMENGDYAAESEQTVKDCFYTGNSIAAGSFRSQLTEEDYDCLLRIVEAEAGICDEKGKILVANVVLNRMETTEFPDTVREVVYQEHQFSPVSSGRIDHVTVTDETVEAVRKALEGTDYSEGALFFVARKHAEQKNLNWFDNSLEFLFEHDGHEFFKCKNQ